MAEISPRRTRRRPRQDAGTQATLFHAAGHFEMALFRHMPLFAYMPDMIDVTASGHAAMRMIPVCAGEPSFRALRRAAVFAATGHDDCAAQMPRAARQGYRRARRHGAELAVAATR